jgi:DtxR family Mn-dependent transcriptional regulator
MRSQVEENYLKAIFKLSSEQDGNISTSAIAEELDINAASVTDMVKKLAEKKLITYKRYQGVQLTDKGRKIAVDIVRKHRLWEVFLAEKLHFNWSEVHEIAEQLEHIKSEELINRLDNFLGNPHVDPHGDPIPDKEGKFHYVEPVLLSELQPETHAIIKGVKEDSKDLLHYLEQHQLLLGTPIHIVEIFEFDNSMVLRYPGGELTISRKVAENLFVQVKE